MESRSKQVVEVTVKALLRRTTHLLRGSEDANSLVLLAVFLVALFAFAALSFDVGHVFVQRHRIQEAADATSLAAAVRWAATNNRASTILTANSYGTTNGLKLAEIISVDTGVWLMNSKTFQSKASPLANTDLAAVRVVAQRNVQLAFGGVVGMREMNPRVESVAFVGPSDTAANAIPFGVCDQDGTVATTRCSPITLHYGTSDAGSTNSCINLFGQSGFGPLRYPNDQGGNDYRNNIISGYPGILRVGDCMTMYEPGGKTGPTFQGITARVAGAPPYTCTVDPPSPPPNNGRLAIVPKIRVKPSTGLGPNEVCIDGFYVVVIDNWSQPQKIVNARFLQVYSGTEVSPNIPPGSTQVLAAVLAK